MTETLTVLVVEDNPADVDLMRETLPETGPIRFYIESVPRLCEALARLATGGIDLVLIDLGLPDSQGLGTFRKLRQAAPDLAMIVLTGNDDQDTAVTAVREGAQDYFVKGEVVGKPLVRAMRYAIERKRAEKREWLAHEVLELLNRPEGTADTIGDILQLVKTSMDFEAVAIRLQEGDDYPCFEASGLPEDFLRAERYLCERDEAGNIVRDGTGNPVLECMCGNILRGRTNPALPFFTDGGSFWTNSTTQLLATTMEQDRQACTRGRCNGEGYESVALIPLRSGGQIIGLLQLNDHRLDRFTPDMIQFLEGLGASIGVALAHRRAEESLRSSEAKYRNMVDNIGIGVTLVSPDMRVLEINRQMAAWFPEAARQDKPVCYQVFKDPPREGICDYCPTIKALRDGEVHEATTETPVAGKARSFRVIASPVLDAQGNVSAAIEMVEDITERLSLEQQLNQAQKMEAVGQLAGGVAHDFNNILQALMGYSQMLLDILTKDNEAYAFAEEILHGSERAAGLTRQLLAFSRRQVLQMEDINLNDVVQGLMKMIKRVIGEDVEVNVLPGHRLGIVHADRGQMEQVLMNLCVNARDAMPAGGQLTIETENVSFDETYCATHPWAAPGRCVLLSVTDSGCGMDARTLEHIFEPFFTTKELGKGTGLGLATVYGIVKQQNGMVNVYSEVGSGTTFKIYLPIVERPASTVGAKVVRRPTGGTETILVAEDDAAVRQLAARILENAGYTVLTAANGHEALRVFRECGRRIDMVLLDVVMPELGGRGVYDALREQQQQLRFLFSSGYSTNAVHTGFVLDAGIELIQKPYAQDTLLRKVREVLDKA